MSTTSRTLPLRSANSSSRYITSSFIEIHMVLPRMAGYYAFVAPINPAGKSAEVDPAPANLCRNPQPVRRATVEHRNASLRADGKRVRVSVPGPEDHRFSDDDGGSSVDDESESSRTDR